MSSSSSEPIDVPTPRAARFALLRGSTAPFLLALALPAAATPPMQLTDMTFVSTAGSVNELVVEATHATVDAATNHAELDSVRAEWAGANGETSLELTCDRGEFNLATNDFVAIGDVRGRLADGRRFEGPWLRYDRAKGVAFTDAPVTILDADRTFRGGGFRYHVREGRLRLTAGASVVEAP
jgi:LPS export ABC transporter protein LptC